MDELTTVTWQEKIVNMEGTKQTFDIDEKYMETAVFELYQQKKRILISCNKHKINEQISFVKSNLDFYPDSNCYSEKTPAVKNKLSYGQLMTKEQMESTYKTMENIIQSYQSIIGYNLSVCFSQITKTVHNNWDLDLEETYYSKYCFADLFASDGIKKVNHNFYHNLNFPFSEEVFKKEIDTYLLPKLNSQIIKSNHYNILFSDEVSSYIMSKFLRKLFGSEIYQEGYFKNKLNTKILPDNVTVIEKPSSINYAVNYDDYGVQLKEKKVVEKGILKEYFINREYGQKLNMISTGNSFFHGGSYIGLEGWTNIFVETENQEDVSNFSGIFVNTILSTSLNSTTGDFICSISGFYMENGLLKGSFLNGSLSFNISSFTKISFGGTTYNKDTFFTPQIIMKNMFIAGTE